MAKDRGRKQVRRDIIPDGYEVCPACNGKRVGRTAIPFIMRWCTFCYNKKLNVSMGYRKKS